MLCINLFLPVCYAEGKPVAIRLPGCANRGAMVTPSVCPGVSRGWNIISSAHARIWRSLLNEQSHRCLRPRGSWRSQIKNICFTAASCPGARQRNALSTITANPWDWRRKWTSQWSLSRSFCQTMKRARALKGPRRTDELSDPIRPEQT